MERQKRINVQIRPAPALDSQYSRINLKARLFHEVIKDALLFIQLARCIKLCHFTLIEHNDAIAVQNGVESVRNGNDRPVRKQWRSQSGLKHGICLYVDSGGCFIQNQNVGRSEHGTG